MSWHTFDVQYVDVLLMLCLALLFLWFRHIRFRSRDLFAQVALTVTGHLRRRPDPVTEHALRSAFAELDKELGLILGDQDPRNGPGRCSGQ